MACWVVEKLAGGCQQVGAGLQGLQRLAPPGISHTAPLATVPKHNIPKSEGKSLYSAVALQCPLSAAIDKASTDTEPAGEGEIHRVKL